jgi:predicted N-acetyltransferase YhbS
MNITIEQPHHAPAIEQLLDQSFGNNRNGKTVYRLREDVAPVSGLSLVALDGDRLEGTIRFWPVRIGALVPSLLLGPIAVAAHRRSEGLGATLIRQGVNRAVACGWRSVLLVGDAPYYNRFGFTRDLTLNLSLPGPVDLDRFLGLELVEGALQNVSGMVGRWPAEPAPTLPAVLGGQSKSKGPLSAFAGWSLNAPA